MQLYDSVVMGRDLYYILHVISVVVISTTLGLIDNFGYNTNYRIKIVLLNQLVTKGWGWGRQLFNIFKTFINPIIIQI